MNWLKHLTFSKLEFTIEATQPLFLPPYKGSTFRGAFGNIFKQVVCIKEDKNCSSCILTRNCSYYYVFETPNSDRFPWFSSPRLPHPYVLEPPLDKRTEFDFGEQLKFNLTLFGKAVDYLPYFVFVFDQMGRTGGIGKYRHRNSGRFWLKEVRDARMGENLIYDGRNKTILRQPNLWNIENLSRRDGESDSSSLSLEFLTPTRIRHNGEYILLSRKDQFPLNAFLENLYRRAYLMTFSHCHESIEPYCLPDSGQPKADHVGLSWQEWERYSSRQERHHPLGGFVGRLVVSGEMKSWLPFLRAGEWLHAGSGTSFGLGKFEIEL